MTEETKERSVISKILLFAGMFGLPAFFILFFWSGTQNYEKLHYYGDHKIITKEIKGEQVTDTIHYKVPGFKFTDYSGKELTHNDFKDKIILTNFIYKDCPIDFCPIDFLNFKLFVGDEIAANEGFKDVVIISLFVTEGDASIEIPKFIKHHEIDTKQWKFVTGDMGQIYDTDMKTQNPWTAVDTIFDLDRVAFNMTLLLDRDLHIRGKYITSQTSETKRVTKEISILLREEKDLRDAKNK